MLFGYQRKPPFGRWLTAATENGLSFPAWLFSAANEFIAHLHAALAVMHDPTTGEHRQIDSLYAMASLEVHEAGGVYTWTYAANQGFVDSGAISEGSAGVLVLTLTEPLVVKENIAWFGNQQQYHADTPDNYERPKIFVAPASESTIRATIKYPSFDVLLPAWSAARTNFWVAGVRTRPVED